MKGVSVVIPSRLAFAVSGSLFLETAVKSIRAQSIVNELDLEILVGVDSGTAIPPGLPDSLSVTFVESSGRSQAAALNVAAKAAAHDYIAILEDDDRWDCEFLRTALGALSQADFVSSTQLEVDPNGVVLRINDFPTPSGWAMRREMWTRVGPFDETFRWHLDNEWLGRLGQARPKRIHLVEATAPVDVEYMMTVRPWLSYLTTNARPAPAFHRHTSPWPLIVRICHPDSGLHRIKASRVEQALSHDEHTRLGKRFGFTPW